MPFIVSSVCLFFSCSSVALCAVWRRVYTIVSLLICLLAFFLGVVVLFLFLAFHLRVALQLSFFFMYFFLSFRFGVTLQLCFVLACFLCCFLFARLTITHFCFFLSFELSGS